MSSIYHLTDECLQLIKGSTIPDTSKLQIETEFEEIRKLLQADHFAGTKCEFFAHGRFQELLDHVQKACCDPDNMDAIPNLLNCTGAILALLGGATAAANTAAPGALAK